MRTRSLHRDGMAGRAHCAVSAKVRRPILAPNELNLQCVDDALVAVGRGAQLERSVEIPAMRLGTVPGFPTSVVAFATDIPAMPTWGTPYLFGPGSIHVAHRDDEHVSLAELRAAADS